MPLASNCGVVLGGSAQDLAIIDAGSQLQVTYGELHARVEHLADAMRGGPGGLALCLCDNTLGSIERYLAARRAGLATALLAADLDAATLTHLRERYRPQWLLTPQQGVVADYADDEDAPPVHPGLALLLSTSGTTGSPKWIRHGAEGVSANAAAIASGLALTPASRAMLCLPMHYAFGLSVVHSHLLAGAQIVISSQGPAAAPFWQAASDHAPDMLYGVPYTFELLARFGLARAPSVTTLLAAGGRLPEALAERLEQMLAPRHGRLVVMYGQSEAVARIAILPPHLRAKKAGGVGHAVEGGALSIEAGEVVYRGANVMWGYAENRDDLARGDELGGVLYTGDLGALDDDGVLFIRGRKKRIAKLFGQRISLDEVEAMAAQGAEVAAFARDDQVVIVCENVSEADLKARRIGLGQRLRLPPAALSMQRIGALPRNGNGKIDYQRLAHISW